MLPSKPALNIQRAYDYLVVGRYDNEEDSFYDGVKHLMPGHILNFKVSQEVCNKVAISRWWRPSIAERVDLSLQDAAEVVREKFLQNIKLHMRSDVPIGAALSGGLDSTAVVCAMRHLEPNMEIQTFSYIATGTVADEESWVDLVNQNIGGISHKVVMKPGDLASDIDDMILSQGEPFGGTSVYAQYRVYKLAKERGVTVMLDGQGADEMLAGYTGYPSQRMQSLINKNQYYQAIKFWNNWAKWPGRSSSQMLKILFAQYTPPELSQIALKFVGKNVSPPWLRLDYCNNSNIKLFQLNESKEAEEGEGELHGRRVVGALRSALASGYGVNALLRHADRNSMRWSVESRVPFLTTDLAEFLLSMPENYLISETGETKNIFRLAMQNIVPDMVLKRRDKIGFQTPEKDLISQLGKKAYEWIDAARNIEFLDADLCFREVDGIIKGEKKFNLQAWRLINFCRWTQIT
jgi:asparagine synthase (glutamine-hydrolysing)